jgi:excisionase family DNA binding protein
MEQLYTIKEVSKILKVRPDQIYLYLKANKLQGIKIAGQGKKFHWRISESALLEFLRMNKCTYLHSKLNGDEISDYCSLFERQIDSSICKNCKDKANQEI